MNEDNVMSESGGPIATPLSRHEEFYYEDGNICLQAEYTVFRLLKSQLAGQSTVFADMFVVGGEQTGPLNEREMYDGVPLVHVDEKAKDWTVVCQILWNPLGVDEKPKGFDTIASVLRISTKYSMDKLRKCSTKWLEKATFHSTKKVGFNPLPTLEHYSSNPDLAAKVITVAQECDVQSVLPLALYHVAVTSSSTLSRPTGLAYDDVVRIMIGRDRLLVKWWSLVREEVSLGLNEGVVRCVGRELPGRSKSRQCGEFNDFGVYPKVQKLEDGSRDPICYLSEQSKNPSFFGKCRNGHHQAMLEIYKSLETIFDLK